MNWVPQMHSPPHPITHPTRASATPAHFPVAQLQKNYQKIQAVLDKGEADCSLLPREFDVAFGRIHQLRDRFAELSSLAFRAGAWNEASIRSAHEKLKEFEALVVEAVGNETTGTFECNLLLLLL